MLIQTEQPPSEPPNIEEPKDEPAVQSQEPVR